MPREIVVVADRNATLGARDRWPMFNEAVVGRFDTPFPLYRVLDGTELERILADGKVTGGRYAAAPERAHGASWGYDVSAVIQGGLRQSGGRLGPDLYVAKIDAFDRRFFHLSPGFDIDPAGPEEQERAMDAGRCNWGLGCSVVDVRPDDTDFELYELDAHGQLHRME